MGEVKAVHLVEEYNDSNIYQQEVFNRSKDIESMGLKVEIHHSMTVDSAMMTYYSALLIGRSI